MKTKTLGLVAVIGLTFFRRDIQRAFDPAKAISAAEARAIIRKVKANNPYVKDLSESLILGVIETESNFKQFAVSSAGALGLMQIKRGTFETVNAQFNLTVREPFDAYENIKAGMFYLQKQISALGSQSAGIQAYYTGLAGYNSGRRNFAYLTKVQTARIKYL